MNLENYLKTLFPNQSFTCVKSDKGLTNDNYLLTVGDNQFMVRLQRDDHAAIIATSGESLALDVIKNKGLDVEEFHYQPSIGIRITHYLPNTLEFQEYQGDDKLKRVAKLMAKFHHINKKVGLEFDPFARLIQYKQQIKSPIYTLDNEAYWIEEAKRIYSPTILCHNDWVSGNILFDGPHTYLIDYEYAADNDPLFDVMSFITENNIEDPNHRDQFYQAYFQGQTIPYAKLLIWEKFHHILWCNWAMLMYENRHEEVYREIAEIKYQAYLK